MPQLNDDDRRVLAYVAEWYSTHRGALPAHRVAEATGLPCETVCDTAGVLAVAAGVRTATSARPAEDGCSVLFLDAPPRAARLIDLTDAPVAAGR